MDERRIFIGNLSKGKLGEENSRLLGSFLVAQFQQAAMARADTEEEERRDFHLYIDELQNFTTDSFQFILSEARKYRLCLTLGHQYISQLPESLRSAVFGNVGTMIALRVGYEDAEILASHFHPSGPNAMAPHAFSDLAQHEAWARIMRDGEVARDDAQKRYEKEVARIEKDKKLSAEAKADLKKSTAKDLEVELQTIDKEKE
jgi:hypothetical protein